MTPDQLAWDLIVQYGDEALIEAARRADAFLKQGDAEGARPWLLAVQCVARLQNEMRTKTDTTH